MDAPGLLALVGSGEYLPVMHEVESQLLDAGQSRGHARRYVQMATAAAPEGDASLAYWHRLGADAATRLGAEQVIVDVRTREDAHDPALADLMADAALIYLSGGNPVFLADTLRDTPVAQALVAAWRSGTSIAGCSAGAMALGGHVIDLRHIRRPGVPGLALAPDVRVLPHFDRFAGALPHALLRPFVREDSVLLGIDEDTALVGGPQEWRVVGRRSVWVIGRHGRTRHDEGPLTPTGQE